MNTITSTGSTAHTRTMALAASPFVTVADVIAFAARLQAKGIPPRERIVCNHADDTRHLVGLRVQTTETRENPSAAVPAPAPDPEGSKQ
jgi:hypothetical protein